MPLIKSASKEAVSENIRREISSGKPRAQSIAIALDTARRSGADIPKPRKRYKAGMHFGGGGTMGAA